MARWTYTNGQPCRLRRGPKLSSKPWWNTCFAHFCSRFSEVLDDDKIVSASANCGMVLGSNRSDFRDAVDGLLLVVLAARWVYRRVRDSRDGLRPCQELLVPSSESRNAPSPASKGSGELWHVALPSPWAVPGSFFLILDFLIHCSS